MANNDDVKARMLAALEAKKGKKGALQRFYERNEFVDNSGKRKDYDLTDTFSKTMYYKPKEKTASINSFENDLKALTSEFVDAAQIGFDVVRGIGSEQKGKQRHQLFHTLKQLHKR